MYILHSLPGRMRLQVPGLKSNRAFVSALEKELLLLLPEIKKAVANPRTGSLLLLFPGSDLSYDDVVSQIGAIVRQRDSWLDEDLADKSQKQKETAVALRNPTANSVAEPEELGLRRQIWQSVAVATVLGFIAIKRAILGPSAMANSSLVLNLSAWTTIIAGYPIFRSGVDALHGKRINNDLLITVATLTSLLLRESFTGLVVVFLVNLSSLFQTITVSRSRTAIRALLVNKEERAWVVRQGVEVELPLEEVVVGDIVVVQTGGKILVDGKVTSGEGSVNQASITGESLPVFRNPGDDVFAGTIVESGNIYIEATKVGDDTALARIIHLVEEAQTHRAPIQNIADRFSERFVPFSFFLSLSVFIATRDIKRAMTMLIIACPCAVGLSTPTAVSAAMGNAARNGILIKGGNYLEIAGSIDTVLFDKTGTVTEGRPRVSRIVSLHEEYMPEDVLSLAASGEMHSNHPLAGAVVQKAREMELVIPEHTDDEIVIGHGIKVMIDGTPLFVGSGHWMDDMGIVRKQADFEAGRMKNMAETVLFVAREDILIGLIGIVDNLKQHAKEAIDILMSEGVLKTGLLSGDHYESVAVVGRKLGIEDIYSDLMPEDKVEIVHSLQTQGYRVAMVGEGVNDAPALAAADVGIAMGTLGTDAAIETAAVVIAGDNPVKVAQLIVLSQRTTEVIHQNFFFAVGINSLGILGGAMSWITPLTGALLHNLSTLGVVINSSRLLFYPLEFGDEWKVKSEK